MIAFLEKTQATAPLLQLWLDKQGDMFGAYERRVTGIGSVFKFKKISNTKNIQQTKVAGLCKLIERGCVDGDAVIAQLMYNKKVTQATQGRQTRSKKKPDQIVQVFDGGVLTWKLSWNIISS